MKLDILEATDFERPRNWERMGLNFLSTNEV